MSGQDRAASVALPQHQPTYTNAGSDLGSAPFAQVVCVCGWSCTGPRQMDCQLAFGRHLLAQGASDV